MPELPEVESFRKYFEKYGLKKKIAGCRLDDDFRLEKITRRKLFAELRGHKFLSAFRHGKFLFCRLDTGKHLFFHFGMTGYFDAEDFTYAALLLTFNDNSRIAFVDRRKIGRIGIVVDPAEYLKKRGWGKDAFDISLKEFLQLVSEKKRPVKSVLMDQRLIAGVGNEFSDEILFQAGTHPSSETARIPKEKLKEIYRKMQSVLKKAVAADAERSRLKKYIFLDDREAGKICPRCGSKTAFRSIGGRSSYFCPGCQVLY